MSKWWKSPSLVVTSLPDHGMDFKLWWRLISKIFHREQGKNLNMMETWQSSGMEKLWLGIPVGMLSYRDFPTELFFLPGCTSGTPSGISIYNLEPNSCGKKKIHTQYRMLKIIKSNFLPHFFLIFGFFFNVEDFARINLIFFSIRVSIHKIQAS